MKRALVLPVYGICVHNTRLGEAIANPNPETLKLLDQFSDEGIRLHERNFFGVSWGHPVLLPDQSHVRCASRCEDEAGRKIIAAVCSLATSAGLRIRSVGLRHWMVPIEDTVEYDPAETAESLGWDEEDPKYEGILLEVWEEGRKKAVPEPEPKPEPKASAPTPDPLAEIRGVLAEHAERIRALESVLKKVVRVGPGLSGGWGAAGVGAATDSTAGGAGSNGSASSLGTLLSAAGPGSGGGGVVNAGPEVAGAPGTTFLAGSGGGGGAARERFVVKPNFRSPTGPGDASVAALKNLLAALEKEIAERHGTVQPDRDQRGVDREPAGLRHAVRALGWLRSDCGNRWHDPRGGFFIRRWAPGWEVVRTGTPRAVKFVTEDEALAHALLLRDVWLS